MILKIKMLAIDFLLVPPEAENFLTTCNRLMFLLSLKNQHKTSNFQGLSIIKEITTSWRYENSR